MQWFIGSLGLIGMLIVALLAPSAVALLVFTLYDAKETPKDSVSPIETAGQISRM